MAIGGRSVPDTIQLKHWLTLVPETRGAQRLLIRDLAAMAGRVEAEAETLLAELADVGVDHAILKSVRAIITTRAAHLLRITQDG